MALIRWEPRGLADIRSEIDRVFDRFWRRGPEGIPPGAWSPSADIAEREDAYVVTADLPGVSREDLKVRVVGTVLTVSGERRSEKEDKEEENYHLIERTYGSFSRSFSLPSGVREDEIAASFKDGVLTVMLPKSEAAKAKEIEVK